MEKKDKKVKDEEKKVKKHHNEKVKDENETSFLDTAKNIFDKVLPIAISIMPIVNSAIDRFFAKSPKKITSEPSEQQIMADISVNEKAFAAVKKIMGDLIPALISTPASSNISSGAPVQESTNAKLSKNLSNNDPKDIANILQLLIQYVGKQVEKSPETDAKINTNASVSIDHSGAKPMVTVTPTQNAGADQTREIDLTQSVQIEAQHDDTKDLAGAAADLNLEDIPA